MYIWQQRVVMAGQESQEFFLLLFLASVYSWHYLSLVLGTAKFKQRDYSCFL